MRIVHHLLFGASSVLLDPFAGDPVAAATITIPGDNEVAADFGRISSDLQRAISKIEHADQMELAF
jgi:hypothetical protein